jgi:hypothetical protein
MKQKKAKLLAEIGLERKQKKENKTKTKQKK